ncbi:MAG: hypothetical protein RLZZ214_1076 [Verrucomicrobiota bacterium]
MKKLLPIGWFSSLAFGGQPFGDAVHPAAPQKIPGAVFCAYYDQGGEGVAYHDNDAANQGSGKLNPPDGTYLHEFRKDEGLDVSYTKQVPDIDSASNKVVPPLNLLYVGWNQGGEWFNITVETAEAGTYVADLLYTAHNDARLSFTVDANPVAVPCNITSTFDAADPIAWRQWHHWNIAPDAVTLKLPKGLSVIKIMNVEGGNINLATLVFRPLGTERNGPAITELKTALPSTNTP